MSKRTKYTRRTALAELRRISVQMRGDPEMAHFNADNVLLDFLHTLGYRAIVKEFTRIKRFYA